MKFKKKYQLYTGSKHWPRWLRWLLLGLGVLCVLFVITVAIGAVLYHNGLKPVGKDANAVTVTINSGETVKDIAGQLKKTDLIRSGWVFEYYARFHHVSQYLQAGTYELNQTQSVPVIVAQLTHGKVAVSLVTILPGQRLDQIRQSLIDQGYSASEVDAALDPTQYENDPLFAGKPAGNNLEGYLYPDSFQRSAGTTVKSIIERSLAEFQQHLTPDIKASFANEGLTTYQGIILASIVEKEAVTPSDRAQAAQVFIKRLKMGMALGSDVTAFYGSILAGQGQSVLYDTPYNTRLHTGLPPTPISNVTDSSLNAVAHPASTDWLFFVAGDDGTVHFSKTQQEHEALIRQYCHVLCN